MYLYLINRPPNEETVVAELESIALIGVRTETNYALSSVYTDIRHSAYLDTCIYLYFIENDVDSLYNSIQSLNYSEERFKVKFMNIAEHIDFGERKKIEREISDIFISAPDLKNPITVFIVTKINGKWMFGKIVGETENRWRIFNKKPHTFCNALPARMARGLVNVASQNNRNIKLLDPCCGMGTILLEALDIGIDSYGYDINENVVEIANKNLGYFNFPKVVKCFNAASITGFYDVSIVDLPYGLLCIRGKNEYHEIIGNIRKICKRSIILSARDISNIIEDSGFKIIDSCVVRKGSLDRYITICE